MADPKSPGTSNKKVANSVVALSSAAVLAVYTAGYVRTKAAAERLEAVTQRRPHLPMPAPTAAPETPPGPEAVAVASPIEASGTEPSRAIPNPQTTASVTNTRAADAETVPSAASTTASAPDASSPAASPTLPSAPTTEAPTVVAKAEPVPVAATPAPIAIPTASLPVLQGERPAAPVAPPATPAPAAPAAPAATSGWKDGKYLGWGYSRHGDIQAQVVIENGRIAYAVIAKCLTRYSCSIIDHLQKQVAQRQGPEVDYVAGATESANAFYGAVVEALKQAR